ncbi:hypothetical protein Phep_3938 [Pedobacter heparinus DSM 2366]|uniref:CDP-glycerol:poly(Glycerophosphate) glycerophosphotransferase n=2 Tax=Pedobacter heparinus TaxID=984 RepID=C6XVQ4_PEDHD|nr:hypothetical protein Phep_3938 [Pedobacter heparinus DSM 2366]
MEECEADVLAISDRSAPFYDDFNAKVQIANGSAVAFLKANRPDLVFTGTSYTSDLEQLYISAAKELGILCYSFVDHWTSISKRFLNKEGKMILPNHIWVIDQRAKEMAISENIPTDKLVISGNPYHQWLAKWSPKLSKQDFLKTLEINSDLVGKNIIVYAPDPLSNVNGIDLYGFDEITATEMLIEELFANERVVRKWVILVKPHPNQDIEKLKDIVNRHPDVFLLNFGISANDAIYFADVVVGFFSSFLIEAEIIGKSVVRFIPKNLSNDPLEELNIGVKTDSSKLIQEISKYL